MAERLDTIRLIENNMYPKINLIVATDAKNGIAKCGSIPWNEPQDLAHFRTVTTGKGNNAVIMGRLTWESLPESARPLKKRINIIVSRGNSPLSMDNVHVVNSPDDAVIKAMDLGVDDIFIIGGAQIYEYILQGYRINRIYHTMIDGDYMCDQQVPTLQRIVDEIKGADSKSWSLKEWTMTSKTKHDFFTQYVYRSSFIASRNEPDDLYLKWTSNILYNGKPRKDRTGTGTISIFAPDPLRFDISQSVPLLTTKRMGWKTVIKELIWFLKGQTDAKILQKQGVRIWDGNTTREFLDARGLDNYPEGVMGPGYSWQWRYFGAKYSPEMADPIAQEKQSAESLQEILMNNTSYDDNKPQRSLEDEWRELQIRSTKEPAGFDQIEYIIDLLRNDPTSRRIFLSAWNPAQLEEMALPPCHVSCQFYVDIDDDGTKHLSCHMYQRSCDAFLGLPFNIFSYTVLTYILAAYTHMKPKNLVISFGDAHIYADHITQIKAQLTRRSYPSPTLEFTPKSEYIHDLHIDQFKVKNYKSHPSIAAKMSA